MTAKSSALAGQRRLYLFAGILVLWLGAICVRLVYLQIFCYGDYVQRAQRQQQRSLEVAPQRGVIYDRNGQGLAMSVMVDSVFAVPSEIPDPATTSALIGRILKQDPHEIMAHLKSSRAFCWIARKIEKDSADRIRALNLKGIYFQKEPKRFYPKRELAAQVLGYVGMDDEGLGGLERAFDSRLRGKPGKMLISVDARQKWFGRVEQQPEAGDDLVLTIDDKIQYIAERELDAAAKQTQSLAGTVIVENPHTGEILALANWPTFDPNLLAQTSPQALNDRAVSDIYEPGSTFKVVTLAAALEEKIARPDEVIDCQMGSIEIAGHTIHDHKAYGDLTVAQVLSNSSDIGAIKLGLRLGDERFDQYIRAFGFGRQTGIELPGETRGMTKPVSRWSRTSIGAISMGQEIGVSAVQLASMMSTIANDGVYEAPRIVAGSVEDETQNGLRKVVFHPAGERRVISTLTAAEMKTMLEGVVLNGTGKKAILDGYTSAGKTGTAQKIDPHTGTYSKTQYIASFAGFAPVNNPAVTVLVILDSPRNGSHEGGVAAAPVWARIMQQVLAYLNVSHDASFSDKRRLLLRAANSAPESEIADGAGDRLGDILDSVAESSSDASDTPATQPSPNSPLKPVAMVSAPVPQSAPASLATEPTRTPEATKVLHGTAVLDVDSGVTVPSLIGLPVRNALEAAASVGLELQVLGSGVAREQSPPPGSHIAPGGTISVRFAR